MAGDIKRHDTDICTQQVLCSSVEGRCIIWAIEPSAPAEQPKERTYSIMNVVQDNDDVENRPFSIAIVDNDAIALYALRTLIEKTPTMRIIWTATTGREALTRCFEDDAAPDVLLIDMALSDMPGTVLCRRLRASTPFPKVLAITSYPLDIYETEAAEAGAQGIIAKDDFKMLAQAIAIVHDGDVLPANAPFETAENAYDRIRSTPADPLTTLTFNEMKALNLASHGLSSKEIAKQMKVPAFVAGKLKDQAKMFSMDTLRDMIEACAKTDESIKTGKISDRVGVELLLIQFSQK